MPRELYAEEVNCWQSSTAQLDSWIARAKKEIEHLAVVGKVTGICCACYRAHLYLNW